MSALSAARNTKRKGPVGIRIKLVAAGTIYQGGLVARDGSGTALAAADTAGLKVVGIALNSAVAGETVEVEHGTYKLANGGSFTGANIGDVVYVTDDQTVGAAGALTNDIPAGVIRDYESDGVWVDTEARA